MIRREIVTGAAVVAAFFTAGVLSAPDRVARIATPSVPAVETARDAAIEPPDGYIPSSQPFLGWPEDQPEDPTLTWPPYGCDAGMWSIRYDVQNIEPGRTRVRGVDHRDVETSVDVLHERGWEFDFYPITPDAAWVVTTDPQNASFRLRHLERGTPTCSVGRDFEGSQPIESRAVVSENGLYLYSRSDEVWSVTQFGADCEVVGERVVHGALATPASATFDLRVAETLDGVHFRFIGARSIDVDAEDFVAGQAKLEAKAPIEKLGWGVTEDAIWIVFWDAQTTYVEVLERTGEPRWSTSWDTHPYADPVTHVTLRDGFLSVRGPLDSYPADEDLVRVFDTHANEIVGRGARSGDERYGWQLDLDCELVRQSNDEVLD